MSEPIPPTKDAIERCAYFIYVAEGRPGQRALDHWMEAESQLIATARHDAGSIGEPATAGDGEG